MDVSQEVVLKACLPNGDDTVKKVGFYLLIFYKTIISLSSVKLHGFFSSRSRKRMTNASDKITASTISPALMEETLTMTIFPMSMKVHCSRLSDDKI